LERQHKVLADRRQELDRTIEAIHAARATLDGTGKAQAKTGWGFTGGNAEIQKGLNAMDADTSNWPPDERPDQIKLEIQAFVLKARKASPTI
jgi:hypothetical protein